MATGFLAFDVDSRASAEFSTAAYRLLFRTWNHASLSLPDQATHYGFVYENASASARLETPLGTFPLPPGCYFSLPRTGRVSGGRGFVVSQFDVDGVFQVGGPVEERGRLRYIDGCSDSLLVPPVMLGHPCLNLLHIPPNTAQTAHTHPSHRLGAIVSGRGVCRTPEGDVALAPGLGWVIQPDAVHSFHTRDEALRVIAFHPDSDCGPTNHDHPMLNRTIVDGVSAAARLAP